MAVFKEILKTKAQLFTVDPFLIVSSLYLCTIKLITCAFNDELTQI